MSEDHPEGFKVNYKKIHDAVLKCELDKKSQECKNALKEIGIEWEGE